MAREQREEAQTGSLHRRAKEIPLKIRKCRWCKNANEEFWISADDKKWHFLCGPCAARLIQRKGPPK